MNLTISVVLLAGIALAVVLRLKSATLTGAVIAVLFGFYLADTDAAPTVNELVTAIADAVRGIGN
ncbi:hypothetical protein GCM10010400_22450 [Streptomyces aculeolatus]|uniref:hypothetical protein n=1 Tax=Streptomyces aculeolatus TaxID=270689 RepID=UPI000564200F|nr:hypothetical protein [Streptomyces aculeolatus]